MRKAFDHVARGNIFFSFRSVRRLSPRSGIFLCTTFGKNSPAPFAPYHEERYRYEYEAEKAAYEYFLSHTSLAVTRGQNTNYALYAGKRPSTLSFIEATIERRSSFTTM